MLKRKQIQKETLLKMKKKEEKKFSIKKEDLENKYKSKKITKRVFESKLSKLEDTHQGYIENIGIKIQELESDQIKKAKRPKSKGEKVLKQPKEKSVRLNSKNIFEVQNVSKTYTTGKIQTEVLKNINIEIETGEFVILFGKSGSGKSTLLNLMSGLDKPTLGNIIVLGEDISKMKNSQVTKFRRKNVGFIFQRYNLLPNLNAFENIETGAYLQKDRSKRLDIHEIFKLMDIEDVKYKFPSEMSGGQQQRISIGRALVKNPPILFGDEPTGALDEKMSTKVLQILWDINKKYKTTIVMVSHNPAVASVASKVIHIKNGNVNSIKINKNRVKPTDIKW